MIFYITFWIKLAKTVVSYGYQNHVQCPKSEEDDSWSIVQWIIHDSTVNGVYCNFIEYSPCNRKPVDSSCYFYYFLEEEYAFK
jgi:hypothetical protein